MQSYQSSFFLRNIALELRAIEQEPLNQTRPDLDPIAGYPARQTGDFFQLKD